ncbi:MAG: SDR family oxidoreductase [Spirochaetota bacterium]|nr:SDR family oxidoreductase [Spirochaetota bacterium]
MGLLDGKVAIITGGGRGVGRAEAMVMAKEGAKVVVNDLGGTVSGTGSDAAVANQTVKEIREAGGVAESNFADVSTLDGADSLMWTALSKFGRLDILVNNAGILRDRTVVNMTEEDWDMVLKVHAKHTFLCTRAVARIMKAQGSGGVIINTTSVSGLIGNFGQINYGTAKAGIYAFTKIAAMELAKYGIRVNCVSPSGYTRMVSNLPGMKDMNENIISVEPTAQLALFFASDLSKDLTGRVMGSRGGIHGTSVREFKMTMSEGYQKEGGVAMAKDIADNINEILFKEADLTMG